MLHKQLHLLHSDKRTYFYKHKLSSHSIVKTIPLVLSSSALLLMLGVLLFPAVPTSVSALTSDDDSNANEADIQPLSMPTSGVALSLDTTPTDTENDRLIYQEQIDGSKANTTNYIKVNFTVEANNINKYQVFVQADKTTLTGQATGKSIQSITSPATSTISSQGWGYSLSRGDVDPNTLAYQPIATDISSPADTMEPTSGDIITNLTQPYTLAFAANLSGAEADHYRSNITLSVAAGAGEVVTNPEFLGFYGVNYMQDMTPAICEKAQVGETARLIDSRDQKLYWVSKLADNNCWMTQNLDLDLKSGKALTTADSDVTANWDPKANTLTTLSTSTWPDSGDNVVRSYDAGNYVYTKPQVAKSCNAGSTGLSGGTCDADGWKEVSTMTASNDPDFGTEIVDNTYNAHYLAGNRYSWAAATAGQAASISSANQDATQSICPKGWRLPIGYNTNTATTLTTDKSFRKLLFGAYGLTSNAESSIAMTKAPLYFLYGGLVDNGSLSTAGSSGYYWSSTSYSATTAYRLNFYSSGVSPSNTSNRYYGFSVRCVAR